MFAAIGILEHAFGKRYDIPIPLYLFVLGGAAVVFFSFLLVLPRPVAARTGETPPADPIVSRAVKRIPTALGLAILFLTVLAGIVGSNAVAENILPVSFWLFVWIGIPVSCGVIGDWTNSINPMAALARLADHPRLRQVMLGRRDALRWPSKLGWWPAVVLYFAAASGELIYNQTDTHPHFLAVTLIVYALVNMTGAVLFGAEAWLARGELFSVLFATWGKLGWWRFGSPGKRGFGGGLSVPFEASVSRITFVLLMMASVAFDGLLSTPTWKNFRLTLPSAIKVGSLGYLLLSTAAFLALLGVAWLLFGLFSQGVRKAGHLDISFIETVAGLLPTLLPIAFAYLVAHNFEYLLINGQLLLPLAGDPAGLGWHLFPYPFNDHYELNANIISSGVVWYTQCVLIVVVHVAAVVMSHRFLGRTARTPELARKSEWPWVMAMVAYTMSSLWLLAQPLVQDAPASTTSTPGAAAAPLQVPG